MRTKFTVHYHAGKRDHVARFSDEKDAQAILDNVTATCRRFNAQSPVGQMLRGERDFWRHQIKKEGAKP